MATQLQKFCKFLNTDVGKLWQAIDAMAVVSETVKSVFEVSTALGNFRF
jgi:hypothetical protein